MTYWLIVIIGLCIVLAAAVLFLVWRAGRRRRLSPALCKKLRGEWEKVIAMRDDHRRILDAETIVDHALTMLGYRGTFADKLRAAGPRFSNVQSLWHAHKLRNTIAHEMNAHMAPREAEQALHAFERALDDLA